MPIRAVYPLAKWHDGISPVEVGMNDSCRHVPIKINSHRETVAHPGGVGSPRGGGSTQQWSQCYVVVSNIRDVAATKSNMKIGKLVAYLNPPKVGFYYTSFQNIPSNFITNSGKWQKQCT